MPEARRTLVKSPPELWAEVSDPEALGRHLDAFGEIRITRLEPESTVAWEGDRASGTVALAPSGWGTKVTVTAEPAPLGPIQPEPAEPEPAPGDAPDLEPVEEPAEPVPPPMTPPAAAQAQAEPPKRRGLLARVFGRRARLEVSTSVAALPAGTEPAVAAQPEPEPEPEPEPVQPEPVEPPDGDFEHQVVLYKMLDALGSAHHRPFSRG